MSSNITKEIFRKSVLVIFILNYLIVNYIQLYVEWKLHRNFLFKTWSLTRKILDFSSAPASLPHTTFEIILLVFMDLSLENVVNIRNLTQIKTGNGPSSYGTYRISNCFWDSFISTDTSHRQGQVLFPAHPLWSCT